MYEFFKKMRLWTEDFEPSKIFYTIIHEGYIWETTYHSKYKYTKLGKWFVDKPQICEVLKVPYYLVTWIYKIIGTVLYVIAHTFFPKNWNL